MQGNASGSLSLWARVGEGAKPGGWVSPLSGRKIWSALTCQRFGMRRLVPWRRHLRAVTLFRFDVR